MSEPLAATLLSGAVLAMLWARQEDGGPGRAGFFAWEGAVRVRVGRRGRRVRPGPPPPLSMAGPGLLLGRWRWSGRSTWRSSLPVAVVVLARGGRDELARVLCFRRWSCSSGWRSSSRPGRCATRSRSIASCRSRPAAARCSSPAPTCRRTAIPNGSARRCWSGIPELFGPKRSSRSAARADPRALAAQRYPGPRNRRGAGADGARTALGRRHRRAGRVRRLRRHQGRADLVARAARRDARAALGGAALAARRASACSASACSPGSGAGRRCCWARSSSR